MRGCRYTKLIDFIYKNRYRYRYHKNLIINNGFLPLVGIVDCLAARACPSHCRNNVISFIESSRDVTHAHPFFLSMILIATCFCFLHSIIVRMHTMTSRLGTRLTEVATNPLGYRVHASEGLKRYTPDFDQATLAGYHISDHNFNLDISLSYGSVIGN